MAVIEPGENTWLDDGSGGAAPPIDLLDSSADCPAPEQYLDVSFRCGQEDVSGRVAALLPFFLMGPRGHCGAGAAGEFLDACREFAVWAETAGREKLAGALGTLAAEFRAIHESPLDLDRRVMGHLWHRLWPELERMRHCEPPERTDAAIKENSQGRLLSVEPGRIDGSLEQLANLLVSVELLGDLQARMAKTNQMGPLVEEMQGIARDLRIHSTELQKNTAALRRAPAIGLLQKVRRTVQALTAHPDSRIEWHLSGGETEIDQALIEEIESPLTRLLCTLLEQGEAPSPRGLDGEVDGREPLQISVVRTSSHVAFTIRHVALSVDPQQLGDLTAKARFPAEIEIDCNCTPEDGTTIRLAAAVRDATRAINGLLVAENGQQFVVPLEYIEEVVDVAALETSTVGGCRVATVRQTTYDAVSLGEALGLPSDGPAASAPAGAVVVRCRQGAICLLVDEIIGSRQTVVRNLEGILPGVRMIAGVAPTGGGRLALVVDVPGMVRNRLSG